MPNEIDDINEILKSNETKDFVKRIIDPENSPKLDLGNGNFATHKMAWGEVNGSAVVFPTVMRQDNGQLKDFGSQAFDEAIKRGEYIRFDDPAKAEWFSKNYKKVWKKSTADVLYGNKK